MVTPTINLTAEELDDNHVFTNLYLYGTKTTPTHYVDRLRSAQAYDDLPMVDIDPREEVTVLMPAIKVEISMLDYMANGPGRHVKPALFPFIQKLMNGQITLPPDPNPTQDRIYTRADFTDGNPYNVQEADFKIAFQSYDFGPETTDYKDRVYIYGSVSFVLSETAEFIVKADGTVEIDKLAVYAFDDNFDFTSANTATQFGDIFAAKPRIDPYDIGRRVEIEIRGTEDVPKVDDYKFQTFIAELENLPNMPATGLIPGGYAFYDVVTDLEEAGTIEYGTPSGGRVVYGTAGSDTDITGTEYGDVIVTGDGDDSIVATYGNDLIFGSQRADGEIDDALTYEGLFVALTVSFSDTPEAGTTFTQRMEIISPYFTPAFAFTHYAYGVEHVTLGVWDDTLHLTDDDLGRANTINALGGTDVIDASGSEAGVILDIGWGSFGALNFSGFENARGSSFADHITGSDEENYLYGAGGNDVLYGTKGEDVLYGDADFDTADYSNVNAFLKVLSIPGGGGNYTVEKYYDQMNSTEGLPDDIDHLYSIEDITGDTGNGITIDGVGGVVVQGLGLVAGQIASVNHLPGQYNVAVTMLGTSYGETFTGSNANDLIEGKGGTDFLYGGNGNDTYVYRRGDGIDFFGDSGLNGETNTAWLRGISSSEVTFARYGSNSHITVSINGGGEVQLGLGNPISHIKFSDKTLDMEQVLVTVHGTEGNDNALFGTEDRVFRKHSLTNDVIYGYGGNDHIGGGNGADTIYGGNGNDNSLSGNNGNDHIYGEDGEDHLFGGDGDDFLYGGDDRDIIEGNTGNDTFEGGAGNDRLTDSQNVSNDTYIFDSGLDTIFDYAGTDVLRLNGTTTIEDLQFFTVSSINLKVVINTGVDEIFIENFVGTPSHRIETIEFSDGTYAHLPTYAFWWRGTDIADAMTGTAGNDTLIALAGNDTLSGGNGTDTLFGGAGNDTLTGGAGNDNVFGGAGNDTYTFAAGDGFDTILDTGGTDVLAIGGTTQLDDLVFARVGDDLRIDIASGVTIKGFYGVNSATTLEQITFTDNTTFDLIAFLNNADTFVGTSAAQTFDGGIGIDTVTYATSATAVSIDLQNNVFSGGLAAGDTLISIENVTGSDAHDVNVRDYIWGDATANTILGMSGNDILEGGAGADTIDGGEDWDYANYIRSNEAVHVNMGTNINTGGHAQGDVLTNIEAVNGSAYNDTIIGRAEGNDYLKGGNGNDTLGGAGGFDQLYGEAGNDTYLFSTGTVIINETGTGLERLVFDATWSPYDVLIAGNFMAFEDTGDNITFNDIALVEEFEFAGYGVMDLATLAAYNPPEEENGDDDDNVLYGTSEIEHFDGMEGIDTVDYSNSLIGVKVDLQAGVGTQGDAAGDTYNSIENVTGSNILHVNGADAALERDWIYGNAQSNHIKGLAGDDVLEGGAGADILDGGAGWDYSRYTRSDAPVYINMQTNIHSGGHAEGDSLIGIEAVTGSNYNDVIIGGNGNDYLTGGNGNDILLGGLGADQFFGNAGADIFLFEAISAFAQSDNIRDFTTSQNDKIDLSDLLLGYDALTDAITDFVQITDNGTHSFLKVDVDGGADNFVQIAQLSNTLGLTNEEALETSGHLLAA